MNAQCTHSCIALTEFLTSNSVSFDFLFRWNESLIQRARNGMAHAFLNETEYDNMVFIDADIDFSIDDFVRLDNLVLDGAGVGVGVYRMKTPDSKYAAWVNGELVTDLNWGKPQDVDYAGTGFMMIPRQTFENLKGSTETYRNEDENMHGFFMTPVTDGVLESEDYFFCRKVREAGMRVIMDPAIRLTHWGSFGYD